MLLKGGDYSYSSSLQVTSLAIGYYMQSVLLPGSFSLSWQKGAEIENEIQRYNLWNALRQLDESQEVVVKR